MLAKTLNIGFIGGGINSAIGTTHKIASQMDNKFKVVSGCFSRHKEISEQTAIQWHIPKYYQDSDEYVEKEKSYLDAIVVLTPTNMHTPIILNALDRKIPVVCEKTLTHSLEDAYSIREKLLRTNGFLVTTYNYTGYPMVRELREMIKQGILGRVTQINIQMPQESFMRLDPKGNVPTPQSWRLKDNEVSTLSLDLGTHVSNMASFLTDASPIEVIAKSNSYGHFNVTDNLMSLVKYSNNIDCQIWYSKSALGHKNGLKVEVYGTHGSASWYQMNPEFLELNDNLGRNIVLDRSSKEIVLANQPRYNRFKSGHPAGFIEAFANHYSDIYEALLHHKGGDGNPYNQYVFNIDKSVQELALMEAIEKSLKSKKWESVDNE